MVQEGTGWDEGSAKSVQDKTERDRKGPDGTKTTELQNRGLQVRVLPGLLLQVLQHHVNPSLQIPRSHSGRSHLRHSSREAVSKGLSGN